MQRYRYVILLCALALLGCENTTFRSSVPAYPVHFSIDTRVGNYVHFVPTATTSYVTLDEDGYYLNGNYVGPRGATDAWGYAGAVVYINLFGTYDAYDLCCPNCASAKQACEIDGIFAVCPRCGEHYDLGSGTAAPQKGIAREYLRRFNIINTDGKLTVTQRQ